jgi:hypothetical protein
MKWPFHSDWKNEDGDTWNLASIREAAIKMIRMNMPEWISDVNPLQWWSCLAYKQPAECKDSIQWLENSLQSVICDDLAGQYTGEAKFSLYLIIEELKKMRKIPWQIRRRWIAYLRDAKYWLMMYPMEYIRYTEDVCEGILRELKDDYLNNRWK